MSKDLGNDTRKDVDIVSGISIDTQYPVEKFLIKWRISNYSKIFNDVETVFSTTSKSTVWRLKFFHHKSGGPNRIELWKNFELQTAVRIEYEGFARTCQQILRRKGKYEFNIMNNHCIILTIPYIAVNPNGIAHCVKFENDVLEFQCTMTLLGHTITRMVHLPNVDCFSSKKVNDDLEKLLQSKEHCDVVVSDGEKKIPAHKAILCARSPIFNLMFRQNMLENKNNEVEIDDIDFDTLQDFISFLYNGKVKKLSEDSAMRLYYAADKYEVTDLRDVCSEFLQTNLTVENASSVLQLAYQHKDDDLRNGVVFFIQMHASSVKLTEGWKRLTKAHPKIIAEILCNF